MFWTLASRVPIVTAFDAIHRLIHWPPLYEPIPGHAGFERIELGPADYRTNGYANNLHHELFEVNHADGSILLDRWLGSFHDGSPEADERLGARPRAATVAGGWNGKDTP